VQITAQRDQIRQQLRNFAVHQVTSAPRAAVL
jgi:hypothetical protein